VCTREIDGRTVEFGTTGYTKDNTFVLYDRDTQSVWYPLGDNTFDAVSGERQGTSVDFLDKPDPVALGAFLDDHPDAMILLPSEEDALMMRRSANRPYMGAMLEPAEGGVGIGRVVEDGPAAKAGLRAGDVILRMAGTKIESRRDLGGVIGDHEIGDVIEVQIDRDGGVLTVELTLGSRP